MDLNVKFLTLIVMLSLQQFIMGQFLSSDRGTTSQSVPAPCTGIVGQDCGPFYNAIALMENPEDLNTEDSVTYVS